MEDGAGDDADAEVLSSSQIRLWVGKKQKSGLLQLLKPGFSASWIVVGNAFVTIIRNSPVHITVAHQYEQPIDHKLKWEQIIRGCPMTHRISLPLAPGSAPASIDSRAKRTATRFSFLGQGIVMFRKSKAALSVLGASATLVVAATPALAATQQFKFEGCENEDDGVEMCGTNHFVINRTETPSGNTTYVTHMRYDLTFTFPEGDSFSATGSGQYHELVKQGEFHQFTLRHQEVYTSPVTGTCYLDFFYHYANGELQFDKTEVSGNCP